MNFTIDRDVLIENLNVIARGLPNKSPMHVLMGILIEVTETDVFLTSSNTDLSVEVTISDSSLNITKSGKTIVPGKFFIDIVRSFSSKKINLFLIEDKLLMIKADRGEYKLHVMDPLDYPNINFVCLENPLVLDSKVIKTIVRETTFASGTNEKKPILTGVNLKLENDKLTCTATDSYRLSQKILFLDKPYTSFNITVPNKSLDELAKALDNYLGNIELYFSPNRLLIKFKNILFQTRLLEGNYPDTSRLIPAEFPIVIKFDKSELQSVVERVSIMSPHDRERDREVTYSIIKLTVTKDKIVDISSNNHQIGDAHEELIPTDISLAQPIVIGFSSRYLIEALRSFSSAEVTLNLSAETRPFVVRGENDLNLTQLILPIRMD